MNVLLERRKFILKNLSHSWLTAQTRQIIVNAFGNVDGYKVIQATNAYLKNMASTGQLGKVNADMLALYINEDPMMVCSLELTVLLSFGSMPIRWLNNNGSAYINLGFIPNQTLEVEIRYISHRESTDSGIFGAYLTWTSSASWVADYGSNIWCFYNGAVSCQASNGAIIKVTKDRLQIGENTASVGGQIKGISSNFCVFKAGGVTCKGEIPYIKISGDIVMILYPFYNGTEFVWKDVLTGINYQNIGTGVFTETFTKADGINPWTPLNQL